jgi:hypothetical protein
MVEVGKRYEAGEYFVPELILAGEMLRRISEVVKPKLTQSAAAAKKRGKVVIGTVQGDTHDIGKNIVRYGLAAVDSPASAECQELPCRASAVSVGRYFSVSARHEGQFRRYPSVSGMTGLGARYQRTWRSASGRPSN